MDKLLILSADSERYAHLIQERGIPELDVVFCNAIEQAASRVSDCHIILGQPDWVAPIISQAKKLKWVQSTYAGVEALCSQALRTDYVLTGIKGVFGPLMSEYVFGYILAIERQLFKTYENQTIKRWQPIPYRSLKGLTMGICGLGSVGQHIAATANHFNMRVLAFKRTQTAAAHVEKVFTGSSLGDFLGRLDYLVITLPLTSQTRYLLNYETLSRMKRSAVLINVGRGEVIVQKDLQRALREGLLRCAILDVFDKEPLPTENPLWDMPNLFITPHNAAFSFPEDIVAIFAENHLRFRKDDKLLYRIDFAKGY